MRPDQYNQIRQSQIERELAKGVRRERFHTVLYAFGILLCIGLIALIMLRWL